MIEKLFKNNVLFISFLALLYGAIILIVMEVRYTNQLHNEVRNHVLTELDRINKNHATKELVEEKTKSRWHAYDSWNWCVAAEKINPGFYCPPLAAIIDMARENPDLMNWREQEKEHFKNHPHPEYRTEYWRDRATEKN